MRPYGTFYTECRSCGASVGFAFVDAEDAKKAWNRRSKEVTNDLISRQAAIDALHTWFKDGFDEDKWWNSTHVLAAIEGLPSAQPEPLTDKEQRIFLAAMGREEKVCKQVDEECRDCREPYEDSLVRVCHEIVRKVKGALWET
jgi:hypothetical protein